ncbi:MAG TPA: dihydrolipoamide acetyltransferase family protein [Anaerolineales bacterium]|nr:dihydrolipoamide acetyltransferase family protein [Anaerolineales bacterium]
MADIVIMPKLGFDMAEGTLVRWVRRVGESVAKGEVLAEIETDKATVEVESGFSGVVRQQLVEAGTSVPIGSPIAVIGTADEVIDLAKIAAPRTGAAAALQVARPAAVAATQSPAAPAAEPGPSERSAASPLARRLAAEAGLDLAKVHGTGAGGRVTRKDVQAARGAPVARPAEGSSPSASLPPLAFTPGPAGEDVQVPRTRLRQAIGRRMTEAKQQLPHFYVTHEYRMEALMAVRAQANAYLDEAERLSVNDFVVKAVALCLRQFPNLNASLAGDAVVQHAEVNVGVAVAVEGGLLTIVTREADRKPLRLLARETREAVARAREGKVRPADVEGPTFTVSNLGMFDVEHFIAIINPPEAAILAVGSVQEVPVAEAGVVRSGLRMKATLSADHRVTDGVEAARFLQSLARYIENPAGLLL